MDNRTEDRIRTEERAQAAEGVLAEERVAGSATGGPGRPVARSSLHGPPARSVPLHQPESRDANVRDALDTALNGAVLSDRDRQFLSRLVKLDKRNGLAVVSLIWQARLAGRAEVGLTARQLDVVLVALRDAAVYRDLGNRLHGLLGLRERPGRPMLRARQGHRPGPRLYRAGHGPGLGRDQPGGAAAAQRDRGLPPVRHGGVLSPRTVRGWGSAVVDELQGEVEFLALQQADHLLEVVLLLGRDAQLIALHLGADAFRELIPDDLRDLPGVVL